MNKCPSKYNSIECTLAQGHDKPTQNWLGGEVRISHVGHDVNGVQHKWWSMCDCNDHRYGTDGVCRICKAHHDPV